MNQVQRLETVTSMPSASSFIAKLENFAFSF